MKKTEFTSLTELLDLLETQGAALVEEGCDVRVTSHAGRACFGSIQGVDRKQVVIRTYNPEENVPLPIEDIAEMTVLNSRHLTPGRAYLQMSEMMRTVIPIQQTCMLLPGSTECADMCALRTCPGWQERQCVSSRFVPGLHHENLPQFYEAQH